MNIQGNYYLQDKKKIKREIELSIRAKYLKELRVKIKKTQKEVALEANVSVNAIRLMEAGETFSEPIYLCLLDYYKVDKNSPYRSVNITDEDYLNYHYSYLINNYMNHIIMDVSTSIFYYIDNYYKEDKLVNSLLYLFNNNSLYIPEDCRRHGHNHIAISDALDALYDEFNPNLKELLSELPKAENKELNFEYEALVDSFKKEKTISIPILSKARINEIIKNVTAEFTDMNTDYKSAQLLKSIFDEMRGISTFAKQENIGTTNLYNMVNGETPITEDVIDRIAKSRGLMPSEYKRLINNKEQDLFNLISEYIWQELTEYIEGLDINPGTNYSSFNHLLAFIEKNFEDIYKIQHNYFNYNFGHYKSNGLHIENTLVFLLINGIDITVVDVNELIRINTRLNFIFKQIMDKYKDAIKTTSKALISIKEINYDKSIAVFELDYQTIKKINNNHY